MTFALGVVAGVVATALLGLFVFKAHVIAGETDVHLPDFRTVIAVVALLVAVIALVRSGHTDSTSNPTAATTVPETAPPSGSNEATSAPTASTSSTTSTTLLTTVTVPNVVGLAQANAIKQLRAAGLRANVETLPLNSVPPGFVVTQAPQAFSTASSNSIVQLSVSSAG